MIAKNRWWKEPYEHNRWCSADASVTHVILYNALGEFSILVEIYIWRNLVMMIGLLISECKSTSGYAFLLGAEQFYDVSNSNLVLL